MHRFLTGLLILSLTTPLCLLVRNFTQAEPVIPSRPFSAPTPRPKLLGLDDAYTELNKPDAIDCGEINLWAKQRASADACAVSAFKEKKPFRLSYETSNRDDERHVTIIGNREGHVYFLSKTQVCCENDRIFIDEYLCKHPIIVTINGEPRIACKDHRNLVP